MVVVVVGSMIQGIPALVNRARWLPTLVSHLNQSHFHTNIMAVSRPTIAAQSAALSPQMGDFS